MKRIFAAATLATAFIAAPAMADLDLAKKSGCLACHGIENKVVGPSWVNVAVRYAGDADARQILMDSIAKGSKGKWTSVTGGVPMPPYSPRVSDANIQKLADFIMTLDK